MYSPQRYADGVLTDVERLKGEGFELIKLKNLWDSEQYKGINSQWHRPETGLRFEVQFHTPESFEAKELTHGAYERIRGISFTTSNAPNSSPSSAAPMPISLPPNEPLRLKISRRRSMAEQITYYAIVDQFSSLETASRTSFVA